MARAKKTPTKAATTEKREISYANGLACGFVQAPGYTGLPVTEQTALSLSPLWCGIGVISEAVGSLPPVLYQTSDDDEPKAGAVPAKSHPLYRILHSEPNEEQTRPVFWESFMGSALLYGNGFAEIERDNSGRPVNLWLIHPQAVQVERNHAGKLVYILNNQRTIPAADMLHVPGISPDGSVGYRLIQIARETIGFGLASQRYGCSLFRNMGRPGGVIDVPQHIEYDDEGRNNLKKSFRMETGGENVGSIVIMEQGHTFTPIDFSTNQQTQYVEILQFFVEETARLLKVSPTKLFSLGRATWGNLTELNRDFHTTTLRPWLEKIEAEAEKKLLLPSEKGKYEIEFDCSELLRTDQQTRFTAYDTGIAAGFLTVDEVRTWENLPPLEVKNDFQNPDGSEPLTSTDPAADTGGGAVQDTALNGAQIASLLMLTDKLAGKQYPAAAVEAIVKAAFPLMDSTLVSQFVSSLAAAPAPQLPAVQADGNHPAKSDGNQPAAPNAPNAGDQPTGDNNAV